MTNAGGTPAGWYHAPGDPEGTQRYWDGGQWIGEPQAVQQSPPASQQPNHPPPGPTAGGSGQPGGSSSAAPGFAAPTAPGGSAPQGSPPPGFGGGAPPPYEQSPPGYVAYGQSATGAGSGELALWWQRVVARLIDGVIWVVISFVFGLIAGGSVLATGNSDDTSYFLFAIATLLGLIAVVAYEVLMTTRTGNTLGKKVFDMKMVMEDGSAPDEKAMLMRMSTYIAAGLIGLVPVLGLIGGLANFVIVVISLVFLFTDSLRQAVWDKIAHTVVRVGS